jgi:hypothetical protein
MSNYYIPTLKSTGPTSTGPTSTELCSTELCSIRYKQDTLCLVEHRQSFDATVESVFLTSCIVEKTIPRNSASHTPEQRVQTQITPEVILGIQTELEKVVSLLYLHPEWKFAILNKFLFNTYSHRLVTNHFQNYLNMVLMAFAVNNHEMNMEIIGIFIALLTKYAMIRSDCNCTNSECKGGSSCTTRIKCMCEGWAYCICCTNFTGITCTLQHGKFRNTCDCSNKSGFLKNLDITGFEAELIEILSSLTNIQFQPNKWAEKNQDNYTRTCIEIKRQEELAHPNLVLSRCITHYATMCPCGVYHNNPTDCIIMQATQSGPALIIALYLLQKVIGRELANPLVAVCVLQCLLEPYNSLDNRSSEMTYYEMLFIIANYFRKQ